MHALASLRSALVSYAQDAPDLSPRTVIRMAHDLNRWDKIAGPVLPKDITTQVFVGFRRQAAVNLSAASVETTIDTVTLLMRHLRDAGVISAVPPVGRRMKRHVVLKLIPTLADLRLAWIRTDVATWPNLEMGAPTWWKLFFMLAYTTGLRHEDLVFLPMRAMQGETLAFVARKTNKVQVVPLLPCVEKAVRAAERNRDDADRVLPGSGYRRSLRRQLAKICLAAGVNVFTPQSLRRLCGNAWEKARPNAGPLILGHAIRGASRYYLSVPEILREAAKNLELPAEWLA